MTPLISDSYAVNIYVRFEDRRVSFHLGPITHLQIPANKLGFELTKDEALISALNREQYNYAKCARNLPRLGTRTFGTREGHRSSLLSVSYPSDVLGNQAGFRGQTG
jgi:hypothetical protein